MSSGSAIRLLANLYLRHETPYDHGMACGNVSTAICLHLLSANFPTRAAAGHLQCCSAVAKKGEVVEAFTGKKPAKNPCRALRPALTGLLFETPKLARVLFYRSLNNSNLSLLDFHITFYCRHVSCHKCTSPVCGTCE